MNLSITFLVCLAIVFSWFCGKYWDREDKSGVAEWQLAFIPFTVFGGVFVFGCMAGSLLKLLILAWPK